jgi:hypothetical protein
MKWRAWEVEALPPQVLLRIVRQKIRENIPKQLIKEIRTKEEASKLVKPLGGARGEIGG